MSHVAFATCDNRSLNGTVHTISSASRSHLTLSQRHGCKIRSSSPQVRPRDPCVGMESRSRVQTWRFSGLYGWQCLRSLPVARSFNSLPLSTHPFGSLYIRNEKRDINSIVFAQRCPVFHFPAPFLTLRSSILSQILSQSALLALPPMTASTRSCVAGSESTLDWRFSTTSAGAGAEEVWIGSAVACA